MSGLLVALDRVAVGAKKLDVMTSAISDSSEHLDPIFYRAFSAAPSVDVIELESANIIEAAEQTLSPKLVQCSLSLFRVGLSAVLASVGARLLWMIELPLSRALLASLVVTLRAASSPWKTGVRTLNTGFCLDHSQNTIGRGVRSDATSS